jgi:hypothetical protein
MARRPVSLNDTRGLLDGTVIVAAAVAAASVRASA